mgnify:CR=1 FL=1
MYITFIDSKKYNYSDVKHKIIEEDFEILYYHRQFVLSYLNLGIGVLSTILYIFEKKMSKNESNIEKLNDETPEKGCFKNIKYIEDEKIKSQKRKNLLNIIITVLSCFIVEYFAIFINPLSIFSYWMIILIIISIFNNRMFNTESYKHQIFAKYFNFIVCLIFKLTSFILTLKSDSKNIYKDYPWLYPIGIIAFLAFVVISAFIYTKFKAFMDLKWTSSTKLLMIYGFVGLFINIIIMVIETYIKCNDEIKAYVCTIIDDENKNDYYIDNFLILFKRISKIYNKDIVSFSFFIIFTIVDIIFNFFSIYFCFLILKKFTPEYYYFIGSVFEFLYNLNEAIESKIFYGYYIVEDGKEYKIPIAKFILEMVGNSLATIGFLIYLGIIELNFCGLNYNLRKNIIERGKKEAEENEELGNFNDDDDDDKKENLINDKTPNITPGPPINDSKLTNETEQ